MKEFAKGFYSSRAWRETQAAYMASQNYVCERCGMPARIVHHKTYLTPKNINDPDITLNWERLEALCMDCHNAEHIGKHSACVRGLMFNGDGDIVPVQR